MYKRHIITIILALAALTASAQGLVFGTVQDAFLAVAQQPEDPQAAAVVQLFENVRRQGEFLGFRHIFHFLFKAAPMVMGKMDWILHRNPLSCIREPGGIFAQIQYDELTIDN